MSDVKVLSIDDLFSVLQSVVVGVKCGCVREVVYESPIVVPWVPVYGFPVVLQTIIIGIFVRGICECLVVFYGVGKSVSICIENARI